MAKPWVFFTGVENHLWFRRKISWNFHDWMKISFQWNLENLNLVQASQTDFGIHAEVQSPMECSSIVLSDANRLKTMLLQAIQYEL